MQSSTSRLQTFLRMLEIFFDKPKKKKKKSRRKLNRVKKKKKQKTKQSTIQIAKLYVNLIVYDWNLLRQLTYILDNKIIKLDQTINM